MNTTSTHSNVVITTNDESVPGDYALLRSWFNVIRAMRRDANTGGYAVISVSVIVNGIGRPLYHSKARVTRLEPREPELAMDALLETLAGGQNVNNQTGSS